MGPLSFFSFSVEAAGVAIAGPPPVGVTVGDSCWPMSPTPIWTANAR